MRIQLGVVILFSLLVFSCTPEEPQVVVEEPPKKVIFASDTFSFSFEYPSQWIERSKELPNNWAILDEKQNTILFTVNKAQYDNIALLGRLQALRDYHPDKDGASLTQEDVDVINQVVKNQDFNGLSWYTYAIDFSEKEVTSIVSGVICGDNEITVVLVTKSDSFEENQKVYIDLLDSFVCSV